MHRLGTLLASASFILTILCAGHGIAQNRSPKDSTSPWPEDSGVIALNLTTNADQAWKLISGVRSSKPGPKTPEIKTSAMAADMCREFVRRYPQDVQAAQATRFRQEFLMRSIELGNIERIEEFEGIFPKKPSDLARVGAFREFPRGPSAVRQAWEKNLRGLPWTADIAYEVLLLAEQSDPVNARRLAGELLALQWTTKVIKTRATNLLDKYAPLDKPVQLKATTLDGKEMDLAQWKDKVVLIHFWTTKTSYVPSVDPRDASGVATAKSVYDKFHDRGLEALSINLAWNEKLVREQDRNEQRISWAHYWAGTNLPVEWRAVAGMPSAYGLPQTTFALLGRNGILRDQDIPRAELAERIEKLLK